MTRAQNRTPTTQSATTQSPTSPPTGYDTVQRQAIRQALAQASGFTSAKQLHQRLTSQGIHVGLATVYRQLNVLAQSGCADSILTAGGRMFHACSPGSRHYYLVCEICGRTEEIEPPAKEWIDAITSAHGYAAVRLVLDIFGRCPSHAANDSAEPSDSARF